MEEEVESYQWQVSYLVTDLIVLAATVSRAVSDFIGTQAVRAMAHHNWMVDQMDFQEEARLAIETLTKEE